MAENSPGALFFVMAAIYAETAEAYRHDDKLNREDREEFVKRYEVSSLKLLESAAKWNYFDDPEKREKLRKDPRLERLRGSSAFKEWVRTVPALVKAGF